jgi:antitoxin MazE
MSVRHGIFIVDTSSSEEVFVRTRVQKWGNSLAVRIPKIFAEEVGLADDSSVEMRLVKGGLLVEPTPEWGSSLSEMLEDVTEDNLHGEVDWGDPVGGEVW